MKTHEEILNEINYWENVQLKCPCGNAIVKANIDKLKEGDSVVPKITLSDGKQYMLTQVELEVEKL